MTSSVPSTVDFIGSFPIQPIKITGIPTYATLTLLRNELQQNAATIPSNRGGGGNGYLGTIMLGPMYETIAPGQSFTIPDYPGAQSNIAAATTAAQISKAVRLHNKCSVNGANILIFTTPSKNNWKKPSNLSTFDPNVTDT